SPKLADICKVNRQRIADLKPRSLWARGVFICADVSCIGAGQAEKKRFFSAPASAQRISPVYTVVDQQRNRLGVEAICCVMQIGPSGYQACGAVVQPRTALLPHSQT